MKKFNNEALILMCNSAHGVYIPNLFFKANVEQIKIWCDMTGHNFEDYRPLNNPENEDYWDAWDQFLNDYTFEMEVGKTYQLMHNEDLWAIPTDMEWPEWP
jgi:hypothetical protein